MSHKVQGQLMRLTEVCLGFTIRDQCKPLAPSTGSNMYLGHYKVCVLDHSETKL